MKLLYHKGQNFGDALNPVIFNYFLGTDFFSDENDSVNVIGIGSILGLKHGNFKKIVFSSGYASGDIETYGKLPVIDNSYEIICVRGPKTAKILQLDKSKAVTDGAVLLPKIWQFNNINKKYKYSLVLHHKSFDYFSGWKELCDELSINLIDVRTSPKHVAEEIVKTEFIIAEAMHGAIISDSYRIPWVPVKLYKSINEFKWYDYAESLGLNIMIKKVKVHLHDIDFYSQIISNKIKIPKKLLVPVSAIFHVHKKNRLKSFIKEVIRSNEFYLSDEKVLTEKQNKLIELLNQLREKYK